MAETIHVKSMSKEEGAKGPFVKVVSDKDDFYFVHDPELFSAVLGRSVLMAEVESNSRNGRTFRRITAVTSSANGTSAQPPAANAYDKEAMIVRECALKAAVEATGGNVEGDASIDMILHVADRFLSWLNGDESDGSPF